MDDVVKRRVVGAVAMVAAALVVASLLPQPGDAPSDPGVQRVAIDLNAAPSQASSSTPDSTLPPTVAAPPDKPAEPVLAAPPASTSADAAMAEGMAIPREPDSTEPGKSAAPRASDLEVAQVDPGLEPAQLAEKTTPSPAAKPASVEPAKAPAKVEPPKAPPPKPEPQPAKVEPAPAKPEAGAAKPPALKLETATPKFDPPPKPPPTAVARTEPVKPASPTPVVTPAAVPSTAAAKAPATTTAPPPAVTGWAVQVGGFLDLTRAHSVQDSLKAGGFASYISPLDTAKGTLYRVRAGPFATKDKAATARGTIGGLGFPDAAVVQK
jgi:cell division septation protein DedD